MNLISICESLLKRNEIEPFLKRFITGDEWVMKNGSRTTIMYVEDQSKVKLRKVTKSGLCVRACVRACLRACVCVCVCMVRLERNCSLWVVTARSNNDPNVNNWKDYAKQSRESDQNDQQEKRRLPSRQRQIPHIFGDPLKIERMVGKFWSNL